MNRLAEDSKLCVGLNQGLYQAAICVCKQGEKTCFYVSIIITIDFTGQRATFKEANKPYIFSS